jgi:hypothetical protein
MHPCAVARIIVQDNRLAFAQAAAYWLIGAWRKANVYPSSRSAHNARDRDARGGRGSKRRNGLEGGGWKYNGRLCERMGGWPWIVSQRPQAEQSQPKHNPHPRQSLAGSAGQG